MDGQGPRFLRLGVVSWQRRHVRCHTDPGEQTSRMKLHQKQMRCGRTYAELPHSFYRNDIARSCCETVGHWKFFVIRSRVISLTELVPLCEEFSQHSSHPECRHLRVKKNVEFGAVRHTAIADILRECGIDVHVLGVSGNGMGLRECMLMPRPIRQASCSF